MSLKKTTALFRGYSPRYPGNIEQLARLDDETALERSALTEAYGKLADFLEVRNITTLDGYIWHSAVVFNVDWFEVIVALPYAQDEAKSDGVKLDRCVAVYTEGAVSDEKIEQLVQTMITALENFQAAV